jgi:hypothetical protein
LIFSCPSTVNQALEPSKKYIRGQTPNRWQVIQVQPWFVQECETNLMQRTDVFARGLNADNFPKVSQREICSATPSSFCVRDASNPTVWNLELELSSASEFKTVQKCLGTRNLDGGNQPEVRAAFCHTLQHNISTQ